MFLPGQESDSLCFTVLDQENIDWDMCADDKKTADDFLCKIRTTLGMDCNGAYKNANNQTESMGVQIYQPIIIIPIPAKDCNYKFNYDVKGNDWECGCSEGMEQSPIDIPALENVFESPVAPMFTFSPIAAKSPITTIDGELKTQEYIKIKHFKNAIRILHNDIGKIVTLDGSVYVGEEIVFHTPAEHKLNGRKMDMEMQIIFYGRSKGDIAKQVVLSFLFEQRPGVYNKFLEDLDIFALPSESNPERDIKNNLFIPKIFYNADEDMNLNTRPFSFYTYQGSLTMPPCSEGTIHYVASEPIPLASVPIQLFREALKKEDILNESPLKNARRTQPLNGRQVFYFDKNKYNLGVDIPQKRKVPIAGHYERIRVPKTKYLWVDNNKPSLLPGAVLVPKREIKDNLGLNGEDVQ
jgi:carbonic anhydrase